MAKASVTVMWSRLQILDFLAGSASSLARMYVLSTSTMLIAFQLLVLGLFSSECSTASCGNFDCIRDTKIYWFSLWPKASRERQCFKSVLRSALRQ